MISHDEIKVLSDKIVREQREVFEEYGLTEDAIRAILERPREFDRVIRCSDE